MHAVYEHDVMIDRSERFDVDMPYVYFLLLLMPFYIIFLLRSR